MGIHVTTNNCKPQVWKDCGDGQFMKHTLVDRDDLLELARTQKLRNIRKKQLMKELRQRTIKTIV